LKRDLYKLKYLYCIIAAVFFIEADTLLSQSLFGFDMSDPDNTTGYIFNNSLDAAGTEVYLKTDPGMFDRVLLNKGLGYVCTVNYPNANRFIAVYDSLKNSLGYENDIKDIIPKEATGEILDLCLLVIDGRARIIRFWYERKFNIKLDFSSESMEVFVSFF
jgi:hypothetical protein